MYKSNRHNNQYPKINQWFLGEQRKTEKEWTMGYRYSIARERTRRSVDGKQKDVEEQHKEIIVETTDELNLYLPTYPVGNGF